jgi:hypothetical protein
VNIGAKFEAKCEGKGSVTNLGINGIVQEYKLIIVYLKMNINYNNCNEHNRWV